MFRRIASCLIVLGFLLGLFTAVQAQSDEDYRLNLHRTFGFSSGSQIRGSFSMDVAGPGTFKSVTYLIDGKEMGTASAAPFSFSFQTSQYPAGLHELSAVVETTEGKKFTTASRSFEFATSEQEANTLTSLVVPLIGGILLIVVLGVGINYFFLRKLPGAQLPLGAHRNYGIVGGGVCPRCHRAYPMHWYAPNLGFRMKFDRCVFCGKWSMIKILSRSELAAAESAELQMAQPAQTLPNKTEEERLKEMIEKSRYTNP